MLELGKVFVARRRDQVDVIANILEAAKRGGNKTQIMRVVNTNHQQIERYLTLLMKKDLLRETKQRRKIIFQTSHKGLKYLHDYYELKEFLHP